MRLYYGAFAILVVMGQRTERVIQFKRGVRQGGNESGLFFVLAMDPLMRWMITRCMRPHDTLCTYADDCGFAIRSLYDAISKIIKGFRAIALASGLSLKFKKCQLVLLGHVCTEVVRPLV